MVDTADVVVVGGGITGLSAALHLRERGIPDVVVLERHTIGAGQSGRAAGVLRGTVRHPTVAEMQLEGQEFFKRFSGRYGFPLGVEQVGYMVVAAGEHRPYVEATLEVATQAGCGVEEIGEAQACSLQPGLTGDTGAIYLYEPGGIYVDPMPATHAVMLAAAGAGVRIIDDCPVGKILIDRNRVQGVETNSGVLAAPAVFLATSVWAQPALAALGLNLPVHPHIAQMAFFHPPPGADFRLQCVLFDARVGLYMRPEEKRLLFVGRREADYFEPNGPPVDPDRYRQTATHAAIVEMRERLGETFPLMRGGFVHRSYACTYDVTPDEMPVLDRLPGTEGLYFALGFSGGGFSSAPWIGKRMAAWMDSGVPPPGIEAFAATRFDTGKLIRWANTPAR